jgi:uncharacterized protein (UPF0335 family)
MLTSADIPAKLRTVVKAIEDIEAQIAGLNREKRDVYAFAKKSNIHVPALKRVVRDRAKDPKARADEEDAYQRYMGALGQVEPDIKDALAPTRVHAREEVRGSAQAPGGTTSYALQTPDPRCRKPDRCLGFSRLGLCAECKGTDHATPATQYSATKGA